MRRGRRMCRVAILRVGFRVGFVAFLLVDLRWNPPRSSSAAFQIPPTTATKADARESRFCELVEEEGNYFVKVVSFIIVFLSVSGRFELRASFPVG